MKNHRTLLQDIARDRVLAQAARRRHRRQATWAAACLLPLALLLYTAIPGDPVAPDDIPPMVATPADSPPAVAVAELAQPEGDSAKDTVSATSEETEPPDNKPTRRLHIIESDAELLALLADQSPMLIRRADGSQSLLLTRP